MNWEKCDLPMWLIPREHEGTERDTEGAGWERPSLSPSCSLVNTKYLYSWLHSLIFSVHFLANG